MNHIIISMPIHSNDVSKTDSSIFVVKSSMSVIEFDLFFRESIYAYIKGWELTNVAVQKTHKILNPLEEGLLGYDKALADFTDAWSIQQDYIQHHHIFEHAGYQLSIPLFITADVNVAEFKIMSLSDWLFMKETETLVKLGVTQDNT